MTFLTFCWRTLTNSLYKIILWVREKLSKWFKSLNKPLRYSFFCSVKGLKNEFFRQNGKFHCVLGEGVKIWQILTGGGVHKNLTFADGGEGGGPKWPKKCWGHKWTAPYRYEGDGNFQEEQICFCYTFPFITFLLFDTTFEDDKLKILLWFGFKVASNLIVFLLSGILIKMMS